MHRAVLYFVLSGLAAAQTPDLFTKAPPGVDAALRARIGEFYQAHVDGRYREAEALVAEDTKDFFYEANKPKYLSWEIARIEYSRDFTRAKATVLCEQYVLIPGFADKPLKVPTPSTWKIEDGKWFWWVDPDQLRKTPWGERPAQPMTPGSKNAPRPKIPSATEMRFIFTQVQADKPKVSLKAGGEEQVKFTNQAQGAVHLSLPAALLGLQASFDRADLKAGESAVLTLKRAADAKAKAGVLEITVEPTNQVVPIQVAIEDAAPSTAAEGAAPAAGQAAAGQVAVDRSKVTLKAGGAAVVKFTNNAKDPVKLALPKGLLGLQASFDRTALKPGETAVLTLKRPKGAKAKAGAIRVAVAPTGQAAEVQVALQ
jgi:hypothetical protein